MRTAPPSATTKREAERLIAASGIRLRDPAAGLRGRAVGLWRQRDAARAGGVAARSAGRREPQRRSSRSRSRISPRPSPGSPAATSMMPRVNAVTWDLMQPQPITLGGVIDQFRWSFGTVAHGRASRCRRSCSISAPKLGDLANQLGWMPPMRSTAIAELRRGVTGDPAAWMAATGIVPKTHRAGRRAAAPPPSRTNGSRGCFWSRRWSSRASSLFWIVSGFIALVISYDAAAGILSSHGFPPCAGRAGHGRHQPDGHEHRRADRLPPHLRRSD